MIIPITERFQGIFNGRGYIQVGRTIVNFIECDDGRFGVDEAVLTNQTFLDEVSKNKQLTEVLTGVYEHLLSTSERLEPKIYDND